MYLAVAFTLFTGIMIFVLSRELLMSLAMSAGFIAFIITGLYRGFKFKERLSRLMNLFGAYPVTLTLGTLSVNKKDLPNRSRRP